MIDGNLCQKCKSEVESERAIHKQTKYCGDCARKEKRKNSKDPWPPEQRRDYMRSYMRQYRAQKRLCCLAFFLPFLGSPEALRLHFDEVTTVITYAELLAIKLTGLILVVAFCTRHLKQQWKKEETLKAIRHAPDVDNLESATVQPLSAPPDQPEHLSKEYAERPQFPGAVPPAADTEQRTLQR